MQDSKWLFPARWEKHPAQPVVNTWTFDRLTPNGNEGVGVQMDYLEHAYETKYYVIDKVMVKLMLSTTTVWNLQNLKVALVLLI